MIFCLEENPFSVLFETKFGPDLLITILNALPLTYGRLSVDLTSAIYTWSKMEGIRQINNYSLKSR